MISENRENVLAEAIALIEEHLTTIESMAEKVSDTIPVLENRFVALALYSLKKMKKDMKKGQSVISFLKKGKISKRIVNYFEKESEDYVTVSFMLTKNGDHSAADKVRKFSQRWMQTTTQLKQLL